MGTHVPRHPLTGGRVVPVRINPFDNGWMARWPWLGWRTCPWSTLTKSHTIRKRFYTAQQPMSRLDSAPDTSRTTSVD